MRIRFFAFVLATFSLLGANTASAIYAEVTISGTVEFNQIGSGFLGGVNPGDPVSLSIIIDSTNFVDSASFPTRGFAIDPAMWNLSFNGSSIGLQNPFPAGETAYFVIRNDDPAVDGFFISTNIDFPIGVPLDQTGVFDQFANNFSVTYTGDTLDSLNIFDAAGTYDFTNLTVFNWTVDDGPFQPLGIVFEEMTIEKTIIPLPGALVLMLSGLAFLGRLRSKA